MNKTALYEYINPSSAAVTLESDESHGGKNLYMKGVFIEGGVRNANQRIYPVNEIASAVKTLQNQINEHGGVLGELDHPSDLKINLDRVSHMISEMWMDGAKGCGKLKVLPTPMGNLVKTMLEAGVKLGVSSRGSGNVNEGSGHVSEFGGSTQCSQCLSHSHLRGINELSWWTKVMGNCTGVSASPRRAEVLAG